MVLTIVMIICLVYFMIIPSIEKNNALIVGEEKYLEFLWMIDGAFNDSRYSESFTVNGKKLDDEKKIFQCDYDKNMSTCKGENFEEAFNNLFDNGIMIDSVYGDKISFEWYVKKDDGYYFTNINTCNVSRMDLNQKLEAVEINDNELKFRVTLDDINVKSFELVKRDNIWKVSKAYYHDLCHMDYSIESK